MAEPSRTARLTESAQNRVTGMRKVFAGFQEFIARGNAIELAVGVVIGAAFSAVVAALQAEFISPLIGWIFGQPSLEDLWAIGPYSWRESTQEDPIAPIRVGAILNALIQFLLTAAAIYFLVVVPLNAWANRRKRLKGEVEAVADVPEDVALLREIRDLLAAGAASAPSGPGGSGGARPDDAGTTGTLPPSYPPAG